MIVAVDGINPSVELVPPVVDGVDWTEDEDSADSTVLVHQESIDECYHLSTGWGYGEQERERESVCEICQQL